MRGESLAASRAPGPPANSSSICGKGCALKYDSMGEPTEIYSDCMRKLRKCLDDCAPSGGVGNLPPM
ncbi:MAG: hypothetical protein QGG26_15020 [Candidatus Undinarchaeales archaeon]|nr:hypothetical protein [Candidatus Undinarchaeales archaeon]